MMSSSIIAAARLVFATPTYIGIAVLAAWLFLSGVLWVQNWSLILTILRLSETTLLMKLNFLLSLYSSLGTNFNLLGAVMIVLVAILSGVYIAFLVFYWRRSTTTQSLRRGHSAGVLGVLSGLLGIGCAACGSIALTAFFGVFGVTVLNFLPWHGAEFGILGVVFLWYALAYLARHIRYAPVCPIE